MSEQLWLRVGDAGDYENFGDDLAALLDYLNELNVGTVTGWIDAGPGVGFATPNYHGHDFVSLFWGDDRADLVRPWTMPSGPPWRPGSRRFTSDGRHTHETRIGPTGMVQGRNRPPLGSPGGCRAGRNL